MRRSLLPWLAVVPMLGGCLLQQKFPGGTNSAATQKLAGIFAFDEVRALDKRAAVVLARFQIAAPATGIAMQRDRVGRAADATGGMQCDKASNPSGGSSSSRDAEAAAPASVAVGAVSFGQALSSNMIPLNPDATYLYKANLTSDLPAGVYQLQVGASAQNAAFGKVFSIPESLGQVAVQRADLSKTAPKISRAAALQVLVLAPQVTNDANLLFLDLSSDDGKTKTELHCAVAEKSLPQKNGVIIWNVDASWLADLAVTTGVDKPVARIYVSRGHISRNRQDGVDLRAQALRTMINNVEISL